MRFVQMKAIKFILKPLAVTLFAASVSFQSWGEVNRCDSLVCENDSVGIDTISRTTTSGGNVIFY